jgi:hypothetical protein
VEEVYTLGAAADEQVDLVEVAQVFNGRLLGFLTDV